MATFDLTAAGDALKTIFQDPITNQIIDKSDLLDWFEQNSNVKESAFGKQIQVSNIYGDTEGVGARAEGGYIPEAIDPQFLKQTITLKYLYGTVEMTKQVMNQMQSGPAAFISWADAQLKRMEKAIRQDVDRQLFGFGAGIIARVNDGSPTASNLGVDSAYGIAGVTGATNQFRVGGRYRFFGSANATTEHNQSGAVTSSKVTNVDRANDQIDLDALASDVADDDYIIRGDAAGHSGQKSGTDSEIMGLLGHVDDANILASYFGASTRSNYGFLLAQVEDGSASPYNGNLTETLLMKVNDDAEQFGNGEPDAAVCSKGVLRNFWSQLRTDRVFNDPRSFTGGKRDLSVSLGDKTIMLRGARQAPEGTCFVLDRSTFQRLHNTGWEWDDTTGSVFKQVTDSTGRKDAFYAYGRWWLQTFCTSPMRNGRIDGLTEAVA